MYKSPFTMFMICTIILLSLITLASCNSSESKTQIQNSSTKTLQTTDTTVKSAGKFLPPEGKTWLIIGQDLEAVGGLEKYNQGYADYIGIPAGVTTYTNSIELAGLNTLANWGSGDICAQYYLDNDSFKDSMIVIGFYMSGDLDNIIDSTRDENIKKLGEWIKKANRPVFLRLGYEFDGAWNAYDPEKYKKAFVKIVDTLREMKVENFATVWQSAEIRDKESLMQWYPGDDYVDWLAYSYFNQDSTQIGQGILEIAREKHKPVMIAESTPMLDLSIGDPAEQWEQWYRPFFEHIRMNSSLIKAVSYINVRWMDQPMWQNQNWGDSRVQVDETIKQLWLKEITKSDFWEAGKLLKSNKVYQKSETELEKAREAQAHG